MANDKIKLELIKNNPWQTIDKCLNDTITQRNQRQLNEMINDYPVIHLMTNLLLIDRLFHPTSFHQAIFVTTLLVTI